MFKCESFCLVWLPPVSVGWHGATVVMMTQIHAQETRTHFLEKQSCCSTSWDVAYSFKSWWRHVYSCSKQAARYSAGKHLWGSSFHNGPFIRATLLVLSRQISESSIHVDWNLRLSTWINVNVRWRTSRRQLHSLLLCLRHWLCDLSLVIMRVNTETSLWDALTLVRVLTAMKHLHFTVRVKQLPSLLTVGENQDTK